MNSVVETREMKRMWRNLSRRFQGLRRATSKFSQDRLSAEVWKRFPQLTKQQCYPLDHHVVVVEEWKTNLMSLAILFHFLCAQHVSDINISIIRSLRLCWWITTSVVLFSVHCVFGALVWLVLGGVRFAGWSHTKAPNTQRTENKTTDVVIHQHSRKLLTMDVLMSETCWAHTKWNKRASVIKLVFHSSTITTMHGPINIRLRSLLHLGKL